MPFLDQNRRWMQTERDRRHLTQLQRHRVLLLERVVWHLQLVWRPRQALATDYKLFVHVADESGRPVVQWDGYPCLNTSRTSQWPVGEAIRDPVLMRIPEDVQPGTYALLVGLYDGTSGERLGGQAVQVATITIR